MSSAHHSSSIDGDTDTTKETEISDERVNNAILFLTHPKVLSSPIDQKISFLHKKGLSQKEIEVALGQLKADDINSTYNEDIDNSIANR